MDRLSVCQREREVICHLFSAYSITDKDVAVVILKNQSKRSLSVLVPSANSSRISEETASKARQYKTSNKISLCNYSALIHHC